VPRGRLGARRRSKIGFPSLEKECAGSAHRIAAEIAQATPSAMLAPAPPLAAGARPVARRDPRTLRAAGR
jgi:hypothetical protein